ncbi:MAG: DEAD/DEAH box helicase, partial [Opitutaceae bacterium]
MPQINALQVTRAVHRRMVDFALTDHYVRDASLRQACDAVWSGPAESGGLGSDLWVEGAFPSKLDPHPIQHFADNGSIHPPLLDHLDARGAFPRNRHPFTHQAASIVAGAAGYTAPEKPAIVVSAGTGAGKTESFLLPLLTDVFRHEPESGQGVSCVILYPMNALVNDQVDRLYSWLQGQNVATVFHFTSETPEDGRMANSRGVPLWDSCRYRTRRQARGLESASGQAIAPVHRGPVPRVVITNYSMLEYMLCRPQDAVFFGRNLRTVVLDEAHLYTGNLAAEIALLLRRLYLKCGVTGSDVVQFATSATIASSASNVEGELKEFAGKLFGKPERLVHVIQGQPYEQNFAVPPGIIPRPEDVTGQAWPTSPTLISAGNETRFAECGSEELRLWSQALSSIAPSRHVREVFGDDQPQPVAPLLLRVVERSPAIVRLYSVTWEKKRAKIEDFAAALFGTVSGAAIEATRILFQIAASARSAPTAYPLLPNRVHFLVRAPEGISLCFRPQHAPHEKFLVGKIGFAFSASAGAGDPAVVGASLSLARCRLSGEWFVAGVDDNGYLREVPLAVTMHNEPQPAWLARLRFFSTSEVAGAQQFVFNPADGSLGGVGSVGVPLWLVNECPATGLGLDRSIRFFGSQSGLQLALMAEAALMEMPPLAREDSRWKPARGRRLLIFSDSRTEAARLGPRFTKQHEIQVFRAAVADTLASGDVGGPEMLEFLEQQAALFRKQVQVARPGSAAHTQASRSLDDCEQRIRQTRSGGAIAEWEGMIARNPRILEILDLDFGLRHNAADWNQNSWEKNRAEVAGGLRQLLAREFMRRTQWPDVSLETAGLVEIVYPGVEQLGLPDEIRSQIPADQLDQVLVANWPAILASLLDTVRTDGAITLGSREADLAYEYGGALVG